MNTEVAVLVLEVIMVDVFVVQKGCKYEGGGVVAVTEDFESAMLIAQNEMDKETKFWEQNRRLDKAKGREPQEIEADCGVWKLVWETDVQKVWEESTEYVSIHYFVAFDMRVATAFVNKDKELEAERDAMFEEELKNTKPGED